MNVIILLMFYLVAVIDSNDNQSITVKIDTSINQDIEIDLVDFIEKVKNNMLIMASETQERAIMVLGLSGTGRIKLIDYLKNVLFGCEENAGVIKDDKSKSTEYASICNRTKSNNTFEKLHHSRLPSVLTLPDRSLSLVDNPEFEDNRGFGIAIASSIFIHQITKNIKAIKFLIMITHPDLLDHDRELVDIIKRFSRLLGVFGDNYDTESLQKLRKSIGIIAYDEKQSIIANDETVKEVSETLQTVLNYESGRKNLKKNELILFGKVLNNSQIEIFSNPKKRGSLVNEEKIRIIELIDRLQYFDEDAKFRAQIGDDQIRNLLSYVGTKNANLIQYLQNLLKNNTENYLSRELNKSTFNLSDFQLIDKIFSNIHKYRIVAMNFTDFVNDSDLLNDKEKASIISLRDGIKRFIQLLPKSTNIQTLTSENKIWMGDDVVIMINNFKKNFTSTLKNVIYAKYEELLVKFEMDIRRNTKQYFLRLLNKSTFSFSEFQLADKMINNHFHKYRTTFNFTDFISNLELLNDTEKANIISLRDSLESFIQLFEKNTINETYKFAQEMWRAFSRGFFVKNLTNSFENNSLSFTLNKVIAYNFIFLSEELEMIVKRNMEEFFFKMSVFKYGDVYFTNNAFNHTVLLGYIQDVNKIIEQRFEKKLKENIEIYYERKIENARFISDLDDIKIELKQLQMIVADEVELLDFIFTINDEIINYTEKSYFISMKFSIDWFNQLLGGSFTNRKRNVFTGLLNQLINKMEYLYREPQCSLVNDIYTCKGSIINASFIVTKINELVVSNLKSVKVFTTISFVFDVDYKVSSDKYTTNSPDLFIISPKVIVNKRISVNLSCETYPTPTVDMMYRAKDGQGAGGHGTDGKPGLPGYNGGHLIILTGVFLPYKAKLIFISNGGRGSEGQNVWKFRKYGEMGQIGGNAGKGGCRGVSGLSGSITIVEKSFDKKTTVYKEIFDDFETFFDTYRYIECNSMGRLSPIETEIHSFYNIESEYLKHIMEFDSKFKFNQSFAKSVIDENHFTPDISKLIDRVKILNSFDSLYLLNNLKDEIIELQSRIDISQSEKVVLNYINGVVLSTIYRHSSAKETALVVDIKGYLELTNNQIKNWKELAKQDLRNVTKSNYENNLKKKIEEANELIDRLKMDIESDEKAIHDEIKRALEEINQLKAVGREGDLNLIEKKKHLQDQLIKNQILGSLKIGCQMLSFLGPKGMFAGNLMQFGLDVTFPPGSFKKFNSSSNLLDKTFTDFKTALNKKCKESLEKELSVLEIKENLVKPGVESNLTISNRISRLSVSSEKYKLELQNNQLTYNTNDKSYQDANKVQHEAKIKELEQKITEVESRKTNVVMDKTLVAMQAAALVVDLFRNTKLAQDEINMVQQEIETNAQNYKGLYAAESRINEFLNQNLIEDLSTLSDNLDGKSLASLDLKKYEIKKHLDELKSEISNLIRFLNKTEFLNIFKRLENAMTTIMDIYGQIENLKQQAEFANYIAEITQTEIPVGVPNEYRHLINNLEKWIHGNIIIERYEKAIEAFKYWSFPFYCSYSSSLNVFDVSNATNEEFNRDQMISVYAKNLNTLLEYVSYDKVQIDTKKTNHIISFLFENEYSFYKWSSLNYSNEINRLLSGQIATLYADVSHTEFDALKFETHYINVEVKSKEQNNKLNDLLNRNFFVEMRHSGVSNYLYKGKHYSVNSYGAFAERLLLKYQYGCKNPCAEEFNNVYKNLADNKPILSPFTFWEFKFVPISKRKNMSEIFEAIDKIRRNSDEIVVSLNGYGQFVSSDMSESSDCLSSPDDYNKIRMQ